MILIAAKLAIEDEENFIMTYDFSKVGVVVGTAFGSIHSISQFDRDSIVE